MAAQHESAQAPVSSGGTMRAVTSDGAGGPEVLRVEQTRRPSPGPGQVLVRTTAAGINRADVMQRLGHYPPPPGEPDTIGLEVSGVVVEVGEGVEAPHVGSECVALLGGGGYAEYVAVDAGQVIPPPPGMDLITAAGVIEVSATVVSNFELAGVTGDSTVLIHGGAGGIGSFAIQYAHSIGATVVTTASPEKLDYCRELGADHAFSYRGDWVAELADAVGGADMILDNQGARYLAANIEALNPDGRIVIIGFMGGRKGELELNKLMAKRAGVFSTGLRARPAEQKAAICRQLRDHVWPLFADGRLAAAPTKTYPLEDVAAAHEFFDSGEHRGKLVLTI